jgi:hypothetical protein
MPFAEAHFVSLSLAIRKPLFVSTEPPVHVVGGGEREREREEENSHSNM